MRAPDYIGRAERLEGALDPDRRDDQVVPQAVVVQRVDAVGEHHDLPPDDPAAPEGQVEEVLATELDPEEGPERRSGRRQVEELRVVRGSRLRELAPAEERERQADPTRHVDVDPEPIAALAAFDVVGLQVDAEARMGLGPSPEHGGEVVEGRRLEGPGPLEVVLIARGQAELEPERLAPVADPRQLVLATEEDVPDSGVI